MDILHVELGALAAATVVKGNAREQSDDGFGSAGIHARCETLTNE